MAVDEACDAVDGVFAEEPVLVARLLADEGPALAAGAGAAAGVGHSLAAALDDAPLVDALLRVSMPTRSAGASCSFGRTGRKYPEKLLASRISRSSTCLQPTTRAIHSDP